ncbi:hypothetical protein A9P82_05665 [Arachidicoccus ginsenosidimutans]|uniref:hypothetical protein n=1 Tax=Arachidicoccus sp. BS20 TaxID=1850526 RepID=UPI0007F10970|nr:hypothetical protein [Arachidicoccus sp. BS20]ANI88820.1 hypothetical protein A9P82_05665 [Arachidicoccus sp. BS20]
MKLEDVKNSIDKFFDNITAENLYEISILKYGFSEITFDFENENFETAKISYYDSFYNMFNNKKNEVDCNLSIAA